MGLNANIIHLRPDTTSDFIFKTQKSQQGLRQSDVDSLILSTYRILVDIESLWEQDHGAVELRDKFHLLRYYLDFLKQNFPYIE